MFFSRFLLLFTFGQVKRDAQDGRSGLRPTKVFEFVKVNLAILKVAAIIMQPNWFGLGVGFWFLFWLWNMLLQGHCSASQKM